MCQNSDEECIVQRRGLPRPSPRWLVAQALLDARAEDQRLKAELAVAKKKEKRLRRQEVSHIDHVYC